MDSPKSPRVVDFSTHFSGPVASRQLVQLGADVIKVESPVHGDGNRGAPSTDGVGIHHLYLNVGTRSIAADPRSDGWADLVKALTSWADVVIVGNRPASAQRMGIDFAALQGHNAALVYCLITGYGLAGPLAAFPAHGLNMDALAGAVPVDWEDGRPAAPTMYRSVGTTLAGIEAALGIYAALHRRDIGMGGQFVHVSIWETALAWMWRDLTQFANTGEPWQLYKDLGPRYSMYRTEDAKAVLVCPLEQHFWERFCDVVGLEHLKSRGDWSDAGMDYGRAYPGERDEIQTKMAARPRDEWVSLLSSAVVPVAPVLDWRETMDTDHARANGVMAEFTYHGRDFRIPTTPVSVTSAGEVEPSLEALAASHREKHTALRPPPDLGEQTEEILAELGQSRLRGKLLR